MMLPLHSFTPRGRILKRLDRRSPTVDGTIGMVPTSHKRVHRARLHYPFLGSARSPFKVYFAWFELTTGRSTHVSYCGTSFRRASGRLRSRRPSSRSNKTGEPRLASMISDGIGQSLTVMPAQRTRSHRCPIFDLLQGRNECRLFDHGRFAPRPRYRRDREESVLVGLAWKPNVRREALCPCLFEAH